MNIRLLFFGCLFLLVCSCYQDPFFKLKVNVINQDLSPIENAEVIVSVQDQNGILIDSANVYQTALTDPNGHAFFEFENLGFFSIETHKTVTEESIYEICGEASVSLEENVTKEITILTIESNCD